MVHDNFFNKTEGHTINFIKEIIQRKLIEKGRGKPNGMARKRGGAKLRGLYANMFTITFILYSSNINVIDIWIMEMENVHVFFV